MTDDYAAFTIEFTTPPVEGRRYSNNRSVTVLAPSLQSAIDRTVQEYPDATLHVVRRASVKGPVLVVAAGETT